jgi:serine/threonine protein kinase
LKIVCDTPLILISEKPKYTIEDFELGKTVGQGAYGKVILGKVKSTGQVVAIKMVSQA